MLSTRPWPVSLLPPMCPLSRCLTQQQPEIPKHTNHPESHPAARMKPKFLPTRPAQAGPCSTLSSSRTTFLLARHGPDTLVSSPPLQLPATGPLQMRFPMLPKVSDLHLVAPSSYWCHISGVLSDCPVCKDCPLCPHGSIRMLRPVQEFTPFRSPN